MKLKYIDALRGLAISAVVVVHCSIYGDNEHLPSIFKSVVWSGTHGVQLFYVVSAFTMFLTLGMRQYKEKNLWTNFFIRRFFRIAPMYYIGILYYLWQDGLGPRYWLGDADRVTGANILSNFFFAHGFNPHWITSVVPGGWSIAVEVLFYCLVPLLFIRIKNAQQAFAFLLLTLALRVLLHVVLTAFQPIGSERLWQEYLFFYLPSQLPVFALGVLFYFIVEEGYKMSISPTLILISSLIMIAQFIGFPMGMPVLPNHFLFGCAFLVLCIALSKYEFKVLVNPVLIHMGKISYSMYLVHFAVIYWLLKFNLADFVEVSNPYQAMLNYGVRLLLVMVITMLISSVFYRLVELPMQRLGKWLIARNLFAQTSPRRILTNLPEGEEIKVRSGSLD